MTEWVEREELPGRQSKVSNGKEGGRKKRKGRDELNSLVDDSSLKISDEEEEKEEMK
jgi:hypothetical protein